MTLKLSWSNYKMSHDELCVWFGGFHLYVVQTDDNSYPRKPNGKWFVTWHELEGIKRVPKNELPGLTDQIFTTRLEAQQAAEKIFCPIIKLIPHMISINNTVKVNGLA